MKNNYIKSVLPNIITLLRIFLSVCLIFLNINDNIFIISYICAGITDVLDGYLARKWKVSSKEGATLDSIADFIFILIVFIKLFGIVKLSRWLIIWIGIIIITKLSALIVGAIRYKKIAFLHTYANKATGLFLFIFPVFISLEITGIVYVVACVLASVSALEEGFINLFAKELNKDVTTIFNMVSNQKQSL